MGTSKAAKPVKKVLSLLDFARAERRKDCKVCALPVDIRGQLKQARDKKVARSTQLAWLASVTGAKIGSDDINSHNNGRHDEAA